MLYRPKQKHFSKVKLEGEEMKIKFKHILGVWLCEWIRKVDSPKWEKEWLEMDETQRNRYAFVLSNYKGFIKKK